MALVDTAVVIGDFGDSNGEVLQVLAPIPLQTALQWSVQFNRSFILILQYLEERKGKQACVKYTHATCHIVDNNVAGTYMSLVGWDVFFFFGHVVPIHTRPRFDLLPPHAGDAGQLHGFPQDGFCRRRDIDTYWLAHVDCRNIERLRTFSSAVSRMKAQSKC